MLSITQTSGNRSANVNSDVYSPPTSPQSPAVQRNAKSDEINEWVISQQTLALETQTPSGNTVLTLSPSKFSQRTSEEGRIKQIKILSHNQATVTLERGVEVDVSPHFLTLPTLDSAKLKDYLTNHAQLQISEFSDGSYKVIATPRLLGGGGDKDIHKAAKNGDLSMMKQVLTNQVPSRYSIDAVNDNGETAFLLACGRTWKDSLEIVKMLAAAGANKTYKTKKGHTALHFAAQNGAVDVVKYLITTDCVNDINSNTNHGNSPLTKACKRGFADVVKILIEAGADVKNNVKNGISPIVCACRSGYVDVVKLLVPPGTYVDGDILYLAVSYENASLVEFLISNGSIKNINEKNRMGNPPIIAAASSRNIPILKLLLDAGADPFPKGSSAYSFPSEIMQILNSYPSQTLGTSGSSSAARNNKTFSTSSSTTSASSSMSDEAYRSGVGSSQNNVNVVSSNTTIITNTTNSSSSPQSPLAASSKVLNDACKAGSIDLVNFAIQGGVRPDAQTLTWACLSKNVKIVEAVLAWKAAPDSETLTAACSTNVVEIVQKALEGGAYATDKTLPVAEKTNNQSIIQLVKNAPRNPRPIQSPSQASAPESQAQQKVSNGGNNRVAQPSKPKPASELAYGNFNMIASAEGGGKTREIHTAARKGDMNLMKQVLANKVPRKYNIDVGDEWGCTALHIASGAYCHQGVEGNFQLVKLLVESGADIHLRDKDGANALHFAATGGYLDIVEYLISKKVEVDRKDGSSALHNAAYNGNIDVVTYLISKGIEVDQIGNNGNSPLSCACYNGHMAVALLLIKNGADTKKILPSVRETLSQDQCHILGLPAPQNNSSSSANFNTSNHASSSESVHSHPNAAVQGFQNEMAYEFGKELANNYFNATFGGNQGDSNF